MSGRRKTKVKEAEAKKELQKKRQKEVETEMLSERGKGGWGGRDKCRGRGQNRKGLTEEKEQMPRSKYLNPRAGTNRRVRELEEPQGSPEGSWTQQRFQSYF